MVELSIFAMPMLLSEDVLVAVSLIRMDEGSAAGTPLTQQKVDVDQAFLCCYLLRGSLIRGVLGISALDVYIS